MSTQTVAAARLTLRADRIYPMSTAGTGTTGQFAIDQPAASSLFA